jgi:PiT family inorganic phosphate transporter
MIDLEVVTFAVIFGGLVGAIVWDLITWYFGLPTSSSHALIGGYAGAAVAKAGFAAIVPAGWTKTLLFIVLSPLIGLACGLRLMTTILWLFRWSPPSRPRTRSPAQSLASARRGGYRRSDGVWPGGSCGRGS